MKIRAWDGKYMYYDFIPFFKEKKIAINGTKIQVKSFMLGSNTNDKNNKIIYDRDIVRRDNNIYIIQHGLYNNGLSYEDNVEGYGWYFLSKTNLYEIEYKHFPGKHYKNAVYNFLSPYIGEIFYKDIEVIGNVCEDQEIVKQFLQKNYYTIIPVLKL